MTLNTPHNQVAGIPPWQERWEPTRFYWARIDAPAIQAHSGIFRRSARERRLGFAFEASLPGVMLDQLQVVYGRSADDPKMIIACGVPKSALDAVDRSVLSLVPAALPPFLEGQADIATFELLTGQWKPRPLRRLMAWCKGVFAVALLLSFIAIAYGMERRTHHDRMHTADVRHHTDTQIAKALPASANSTLPGSLRVLTELRTLEQTRGSSDAVAIGNATAALASLLERWPEQLHFQIESMSIAPGAMNLQGRAPSMTDVQALATAMGQLEGWRVHQPQSSARSGSVSFTLRLLQVEKEPMP